MQWHGCPHPPPASQRKTVEILTRACPNNSNPPRRHFLFAHVDTQRYPGPNPREFIVVYPDSANQSHHGCTAAAAALTRHCSVHRSRQRPSLISIIFPDFVRVHPNANGFMEMPALIHVSHRLAAAQVSYGTRNLISSWLKITVLQNRAPRPQAFLEREQ